MDRAVLRALVGDEGGAEEVGAALQLQTHFPAEIWDLLRQPDGPDGGAVRFPFVPADAEQEFRNFNPNKAEFEPQNRYQEIVYQLCTKGATVRCYTAKTGPVEIS